MKQQVTGPNWPMAHVCHSWIVAQMKAFRMTMEACGLSDLGFDGNKFTWSNNKYGEAFTKTMVHRAFSNNNWTELFPRIVISTLLAQSSDHGLILIFMESTQYDRISMTKPFRYEAS